MPQQSEAATTEYIRSVAEAVSPSQEIAKAKGTPQRRQPDPSRIRRHQGQGAEPGLTVPLRPVCAFPAPRTTGQFGRRKPVGPCS